MDIKELLGEFRFVLNEIRQLSQRIEKLQNAPSKIVSDSVRGSSHDVVARERIFTITGLDQRNRQKIDKLTKILENRASRLMDILLKVEDFVSTIPRSDIRQIIDCYYVQGLTWAETATIVYGSAGEDAPRKALERFLEKI